VTIRLENTGKRFRRDWIFRGINDEFQANDIVALTGANGAGKSTFLQLLAGYLTPSEGMISWKNPESVSPDQVYRFLSWTAPSNSLYEELTLHELISFHSKFKSWRMESSSELLAERIGLESSLHKPLRFFSSGMKQRVKLGLSILSDTPLLLLDEPASHLDLKAIEWFNQILGENMSGRIVWIASNRVESETTLCNRSFDISSFKKNS